MIREYEVKLRVSDLNNVREVLTRLGSEFVGNYMEKDYYIDFRKCLGVRGEDAVFRVRIRTTGNVEEGELTIKGPKEYHYGIKVRDEVNVKIEKPEEVVGILKKLGVKVLEVVKVREEYVLGRYRIFLDNVYRLGNFIEVEIPEVEDMSRAKEELDNLLKKLGITGELISKSYVEMIMELGSHDE